jgi:hypothetical protein
MLDQGVADFRVGPIIHPGHIPHLPAFRFLDPTPWARFLFSLTHE